MSLTVPNYDRSPAPRYLQVAAAIRRRIEDGVWKPGERIATLAELEAEFHVARVTVRQAIELLQNEGLIRRVQGKGTFVHGAIEDKRWLKLDLHWEGLVRTLATNVPRFTMRARPGPAPALRSDEGRPAASYVHLESVQSRGSEPYAYARVDLAGAVHDLAPERFAREPAVVVLASLEGLRIARARQGFIVGAADTRIAEHLKIGIGSPTVEARLVVTDADDVVLYVGLIAYRGDCVTLDVDLMPANG